MLINNKTFVFIIDEHQKYVNKERKESILRESEKWVLGRWDAGEHQTQIGARLKLSTSSIRTILKN